ncbi:MAG: cell division protein ZapB [Acidobacteriota bacterium]|nr:cell division protein ZapB [Acidobacteriota bacterium]
MADPQDLDALSHLEERVQKAVALVVKLREELAETKELLDLSQSESAKLTGELAAMRAERQQVRGRLEKLLDHIDTLGATA